MRRCALPLGTKLGQFSDSGDIQMQAQEVGDHLGRASPEPVGAENLCHQAIFMDHASCAVTSVYPEMV